MLIFGPKKCRFWLGKKNNFGISGGPEIDVLPGGRWNHKQQNTFDKGIDAENQKHQL